MKTNLIRSDCEYNRIFENMRGVDFSGNKDSQKKRYSYLENMYRDYNVGKSDLIESVPGFRRIYSGESIKGLHIQITSDGTRYLVINDNGALLRCKENDFSSQEPLSGSSMVGRSKNTHAFNFKGKLYIGDSYNLKVVENDGLVIPLIDNTGNAPYIPTVYLNGMEYEERNLLTAYFYERHNIHSIGKFARGTSSLLYRITDEDTHTCSVSGISEDPETVYIPSVIMISGVEYTVTKIESAAFSGKRMLSTVYISDSITSVGAAAFFGCSSLKNVKGGTGLTEICDRAFASTPLEDIYLPLGTKRIGINAIPASATVKYEFDAEAYGKIEGMPSNPVEYGAVPGNISLGIKLRSLTERIAEVTVDGQAVSFSTLSDSSGLVTEIVIDDVDRYLWVGKTISVLGYANTLLHQPDMNGNNFTAKTRDSNYFYTRALSECTCSAIIGRRVFLWGGENHPGVIFYSNRDDALLDGLYFGALDYIDEGANAEILSVLGFSDNIIVFSKRTDGSECIHLYSPEEITDIPSRTVYRLEEAHRGHNPLGAAINNSEEILYVSEGGLYTIAERSLYLTRSVKTCSTAVSAMLAKEDLSKASLAYWCGYIVLSVEGRMYLADTRSKGNFDGEEEYEWFFLNGIGTYRNDSRVYRYSTTARDGYITADTPDEIATEEIWSEADESNDTVYFVKKGDEKILVYPTEQYVGGSFHPAEIMLESDDRLIFSTACGDVCVFNNDMRGKAPQRIAAEPDFDPEEYRLKMGDRIHPDFYGFHNHAPLCALVSGFDDCDVPHLRKSTVKRSLTAKIANLGEGRISCAVGRDGGEYRQVCVINGNSADFSSVSFRALPFCTCDSTTVTLPEKERGWVEKSIALYSEDFCAPIGVYSIGYRYRISGRIKNS